MSFPIFLRTFVALNYETTEIYIIFLITNKQIKKYEETIYFIDACAYVDRQRVGRCHNHLFDD